MFTYNYADAELFCLIFGKAQPVSIRVHQVTTLNTDGFYVLKTA